MENTISQKQEEGHRLMDEVLKNLEQKLDAIFGHTIFKDENIFTLADRINKIEETFQKRPIISALYDKQLQEVEALLR